MLTVCQGSRSVPISIIVSSVVVFFDSVQSHHTCDKFQRGIREVFLSFPGGFEICIEYIRIFFTHFLEISKFW